MTIKYLVSGSPPYFFHPHAPTFPSEQVKVNDRVLWRVWYRHCEAWHHHGPAPGHREAHCHDPLSPYERDGYNVKPPDGWGN